MVLILSLFIALLLSTFTIFILYMLYKIQKSRDASFFSNITVAHRGCMHEELNIPENSVESLKYALHHKVDGVELDVVLSSDGELMVFHDTHTMARVCESRHVLTKREEELLLSNDNNNDSVAAATSVAVDKISQMTKQQIQSGYAYRKGTVKDATIPTLSEYIDVMLSIDPTKLLMIELKEYGKRTGEMARAIVDIFHKYPHLYTQSVVASFNPVVLYMVRKREANIVTNLLVKKNMLSSLNSYTADTGSGKNTKLHNSNSMSRFKTALHTRIISAIDHILYVSMVSWLPDFIGAGVIGIHQELAQDLEFVKSLQNRGYKVNVWTVNSIAQKRALEKLGGIAITSDFLFDYSETNYQIPDTIKKELAIMH